MDHGNDCDGCDTDHNMNYFLVAFNSEMNTTDPLNITCSVSIEGFAFIGTYIAYFEELMGASDRLPNNYNEILTMMKLRQRFNPQRHIRIYAVQTEIDEETFREYCYESPAAIEALLIDKGIKL